MLYHVIRRSPPNNTNFSKKPLNNYKNGSILKLMPRYHYSKLAPNNVTSSSESFFPRQHSTVQSLKPTMTATTTSNNNHTNQYSSSGSFKSTFIPLVTNIRTVTPSKREFIQIPITREDGTSTTTAPTAATNNAMRTVPITFVSDTNLSSSSSTTNNHNHNNGNISPKPHYTSLFRPSSRYAPRHLTNTGDELSTSIPRLPSVSRRLSLTIPVMTATTIAKPDDDTIKQNVPPSPIRQIPIRLSQPANAASIPTNSTRISSAILRSSPLSNPLNNQLKRQKTDLTDISSSDFTVTTPNSSPVRRAELMAREAIQGVVRFQQQQQQQRNDSTSDNNNNNNNNSNYSPNGSIRSPGLSRRVIVNLKNNQTVSLDSRLLSANSSLTKPPPVPSSARIGQRNNLYHIPVLHEIQIPSHPATNAAEFPNQMSQSPSTSNRNTNNFKNEFRMEIPVTVITSNNDQENSIQENDGKEDGIIDYDPQITIITERIPSANGNSNQTLKSILKRSSSRETCARKNVSFMNV